MTSSPPPTGLSSAAARAALERHGPNQLTHGRPRSRLARFARQLVNPFVWLLFGAAVVSGLAGELVDAGAIVGIVLINALVGFLQEDRAERALRALATMTAPRARVLRDGRQKIIAAAEVVPGDLLLLEAGDLVAADARLHEAHILRSNEAALTGDSMPVGKHVGARPEGTPLAERSDAVFMGTAIATGTGIAQVFATGMQTELGKIAHLLATAQPGPTPLQQRLARLSRQLMVACLALVAATAGLGLWRGQPPLEVFLAAVSLAVAAVPEGLPAVITIALALGVQRLAARHVLVRRMPAVETLGSATVICTDKTGTLTTGTMAVRDVFGPAPDEILAAACACCDAELALDGQGGTGDPTELALLAAGAARGITRAAIETENPRVVTNPFDSERKRMSIQRRDGTLFVKGAPDLLLPLCRGDHAQAAAANLAMAARGLRVLAVATGTGSQERDLELLGLVGLADPPRAMAAAAVAAARGAGVRTVMITGDQAPTAQAIARELGILGPGDDPAELVHARATPEDKLNIVRGWKERGAIVAMTGDGVNDAPALREAHIGIAMGQAGTEVAREAADVVLADDDFASIVAGVREGRGIFANIRKTLVYLLTGNAAELLLMFAAALGGWPAPLLPLHLLWINLVTDGFPALALVMDPAESDVLKQPPRPPHAPLLGRREWTQVLLTGVAEAAVVLSVYLVALDAGGPSALARARDLGFTTLVACELFRAFAARSPRRLFIELGLLGNPRLVAVVGLSLALQVALHHVPVLRTLFGLEPLGVDLLLATFALGLVPAALLELAKLVARVLERRAGRG